MSTIHVLIRLSLLAAALVTIGSCSRKDPSGTPTICSANLHPIALDRESENVPTNITSYTSNATRTITIYRSDDLSAGCYGLINSTSFQNMSVTVAGETAESSSAVLLEVIIPPDNKTSPRMSQTSRCPWPDATHSGPDNSFVCKSLTYSFPPTVSGAGGAGDAPIKTLDEKYANNIYAVVSIFPTLFTPEAIPTSLTVSIQKSAH